MKTKNACILLLAALTMTACKYDDSALWEQVNQNTERIAALEAWQAETNTNIQSLQTLLNTADYITAVTPVMENGVEVGYTISFLNSDPVTIYHVDNGTAGSTPEIGVRQEEDGKWYWTLNGDLLTDVKGKPIRANGDSAPVPQLSTGASLTVSQDSEGADIVDDAIYLSVDGGETWTRVSGTDGDSFFSKVDTSNPTCVIFTLADGTTTFSVPRYTGIKVDFGDTPSLLMAFGEMQTVNFTAEGSESFTTDNLFIIAPDGWKAEVTLPTRAATEFILKVTAPADATSGAAEGEILVMLDNQQGNTTIGRIKVECKDTYLVMHEVSAGGLATAISARTDLTRITVTSGTLDEGDWAAVVKNNATLLYLDLAGATYEGTDKDILAYSYNGANGLPLLTIQLPQGVTGLGEFAFAGCSALTSIDLPDKVTSIGNRAFYGCTSLTSITLPEGLESIGEYTFYMCTSLTSVDLPDGVKSIGDRAFYDCKALESIDLPEGLTSIGENAFYSCTSLTSIDLPEELASIGESAFYTCTSLTSIDLPEGVTDIGESAFYYCTSLASITLPDGVTTIGNSAFRYCKALTSIDLPDGVTTIGSNTFSQCSALKSIDLPEGLTSIGEYAFNSCNVLTSIDLPSTLESIGEYAFANCYALTSIDLPEGLTSIGEYAFNSCNVLTSIDLPSTLESIGDNVFSGCYALTSITLPAGVTSIGNLAFWHCTSLTTVTCQATEVPDLGDNAFYGCTKLANIYVPDGSVTDYQGATNWSVYKNIIQAIQ